MILTEAEASTKWCVHCGPIPVGGQVQVFDPRAAVNLRATFVPCQGSRCFHWRWWWTEPNEVKRGYCGLAGPPTADSQD